MADANAESPAVNSGAPAAPAAESAPVATPAPVAQPPAGEQPVANGEGQKVPYDRFHEVIEQRNREKELREQYETKIRDLESRLQGPTQNHVESQVQRLVKNLGMSEEAARELIAASQEVARKEREGVEARMRQYEIREWSRGLAERHKDYRELAPQMEKAFDQLPPHMQQMVVSSPEGLESFYKSVKADHLEKKMQESFNAGANQAYDKKAEKQAVASIPGSSANPPTGKLTRQAIADMSVEEYRRRLPEINMALEKGLIE